MGILMSSKITSKNLGSFDDTICTAYKPFSAV